MWHKSEDWLLLACASAAYLGLILLVARILVAIW